MTRRRRVATVVVAVILAATVMRSPINGLGPILDQIGADFDLTEAATGLLAALPLLAFAVFSPMAPTLTKRISLDSSISLFLGAICLGIVVRALPHAAGLYGGTVLLSAGIAGVNVLLPAVVKRDFADRVSTVTAVYTVVMMLFASLAALTAYPLTAATGWRTAASVALPLAVLANLAWLWSARQVPTSEPQPEPDVVPQAQLDTVQAQQGTTEAQPGTVEVQPSAVEVQRGNQLPIRSRLAWFCTAYMGLQAFGFFIAINLLPRTLSDLGVGQAAATSAPGIVQLGQMAAIVAMPLVARLLRGELLRSLTAAGLLLIGYLGVLLLPMAAALWCVLIGLGGGMSIVIALALFSLRTRNHMQAAVLSGMSQSGGYLLAALGPPLFAALHGLTGGWSVSLWLLIGVAAAQAVTGAFVTRGFVPGRCFTHVPISRDPQTLR